MPFDGGAKAMLTVPPDGKIWKCFKCGRGGKAVKFIMEMKKLSFPNAVRFLADKLQLHILENEA